MKALTVCQPWAWALIHGAKRVENRAWPVSYRGPILIHAGKSRDWLCARLNDGTRAPLESQLVFGALIGLVTLVDCLRVDVAYDLPGEISRAMNSPFAEGPWCWVLLDPKPLAEPIPWRGERGLFDVPNEQLWPLRIAERPAIS